jgi:2-polyprenyl-6-methoxyphenol hydroxylase-like FAD-dependent oxidoreductase
VSRTQWLVVGGGIGGLSAALALGRAGQQVRLLERAAAFREIGAGLQIGANATRVMHRLGILDAVEEVAVHPDRGVMMDAVDGTVLTALTLGRPYRDRYGYPYLVMHRSDLLDILLAACRNCDLISLENGKHVVAVASRSSGGSSGGTVTCADGSSYEADVIVGADGIRSTVRQLIDRSEPIASGYVAYRGTMPVTEVAGINPGDVIIWIGPDMHLVQYPIRRGELYNQVAVFHSYRWEAGEQDWGTPDELDERFALACDPVRQAVALVGRDQRSPIFERDPLPTWRQGRAVLIGDAAHPMLQYLGQGACQAMEDALVLAERAAAAGPAAVGPAGLDPAALDKALLGFEESRLPRTTRCQLTARPWGRLWHTTDPLLSALRNRLMRARAYDDYSDVDWLYAEQPA